MVAVANRVPINSLALLFQLVCRPFPAFFSLFFQLSRKASRSCLMAGCFAIISVGTLLCCIRSHCLVKLDTQGDAILYFQALFHFLLPIGVFFGQIG